MTIEARHDDSPVPPQDAYARIAAEAERFDRAMAAVPHPLAVVRRLLRSGVRVGAR